METEQAKKLAGYCGLYCGTCGVYKGRIVAKIAADFRELIAAHEFAEWVPKYEKIDFSFDEFQKGVKFFSNQERGPYCQTPCQQDGGVPFCEIRPCAREKGVAICFECEEFPCRLFSPFLKRHPEIVDEEKKFKELGMERWVESLEEESERGYARATGKYYSEPTKEK